MSRPLEDVQDEILDRIHAGETVDREALLAEHPEHVEALSAFFEVLDVVEGGADGGPELVRLGEFRILRELGRGGMGRVYEAEQTSLKRRVALKVLPPTLRLDGRLVSRFRREAEAAGRLRHAGIVPVFSVGEAAGTPFFAMELVEGVSLQQVLEKRRAGEDVGLPTDPEGWRRWAVETVAKVADALAYAHEQGILHRDVKPGNILLDPSGEPRLTDFGLALDMRAPELTQVGEVFGSPQYMSPEQAIRRDTPIDERTDVYSLAVTLYELITLRLPYDGTTSAEVLTALVAGKVVPPRKVDPTIPRPLEQVLLGALSKDPEDRYRGAAALAEDLRATLAGSAPVHRPATPSGKRRKVWIRVAIAAAIVALAFLFRPDPDEPNVIEDLHAKTGEANAAAAQVLSEYVGLGPNVTPRDYEVAIARLRAIDAKTPTPRVKDALRQIYEGYVRGPGRDDAQARKALGHREFQHEVPEGVPFRNYPYLRAVDRATAKRWFGPDEERDYLLAQEAWDRTVEHTNLLLSDRLFRTADKVRAQIGMDGSLGKYHVTTRWAGPYLLCHLGSTSSSKFDVVGIVEGDEAEVRLAEVDARQRTIDKLLGELGTVFTALSDEYQRRWGEALGLKPLTDPWGGCPELPLGTRSFEDGVPLVVLVFESRETWGEYVEPVMGAPVPPGMPAFFTPTTGFIYLHAASPGDASAMPDPHRLLHEAVHQLQYWYRRQHNKWREGANRQDWFEDGQAEYLSGASRGDDGDLVFTGLNPLRLRSMQGMRKALRQRGRDYPLLPLGRLVAFQTLNEAMRWIAGEFGLPPAAGISIYFDQSWALTYFLNEAEDGRYRKGYETFCDGAMGLGWFGQAPVAFGKALGVQAEEDYDRLEAAFRAYVNDHLMKLELE